MSKQNNSSLDRSLQKLEFEMEWSTIRSQVIREKVKRDIEISNRRQKVQKAFIYSASSFLLAGFLFFLAVQTNVIEYTSLSELIKSTDGKEAVGDLIQYKQLETGIEIPVLTEKGEKYIVFPTEPEKSIDSLLGKTEGIYVSHYDNTHLNMSVTYATTTPGRFVSIDTQSNESGSIEEAIRLQLNHDKYPTETYKTKEIRIGNKRAVLQEPATEKEYGGVKLSIVTEKYIYRLYSNQMEWVTFNDNEAIKKEIIELAKLFNFDAEY
ncbi:hypothetical protein [Fredinandcohnia sp. 179-A 10B2 NHS]|uniref:hypothetical protein n=1 Tax=Fredinandcohnia sp. 179-A 10B2 NHS TaxID=3235176 RepID=UPI0039A20B6E